MCSQIPRLVLGTLMRQTLLSHFTHSKSRPAEVKVLLSGSRGESDGTGRGGPEAVIPGVVGTTPGFMQGNDVIVSFKQSILVLRGGWIGEVGSSWRWLGLCGRGDGRQGYCLQTWWVRIYRTLGWVARFGVMEREGPTQAPGFLAVITGSWR